MSRRPPRSTGSAPLFPYAQLFRSREGNAVVRSYGSAASIRLGSADRDVAIGAVAGTGTGLGFIIDGAVLGDGLYAGKDGNAIQIGGLGGAVTIAGGIGIGGTGSVAAKSKDKAATAIRIGSGASTPEIRNAGKIEATTGGRSEEQQSELKALIRT